MVVANNYNKIYYQKNREIIKEQVRKWRKLHPDHRYFHTAKQRAKKNGQEFTIDYDFYLKLLEETKVCPILGLELGKNFGGKKPAPWSRSLDRIDNSRGYTPDNVQIISYRANELKRDATEEELNKFSQWTMKRTVNNGFKNKPKKSKRGRGQ